MLIWKRHALPTQRPLHTYAVFFSKKSESQKCLFCDLMIQLQSGTCECGVVYEIMKPPTEDQRIVHNYDVGLGRVVGILHQRASETLSESGLMDVRFSKGED
jgi:hypothetical protein